MTSHNRSLLFLLSLYSMLWMAACAESFDADDEPIIVIEHAQDAHPPESQSTQTPTHPQLRPTSKKFAPVFHEKHHVDADDFLGPRGGHVLGVWTINERFYLANMAQQRVRLWRSVDGVHWSSLPTLDALNTHTSSLVGIVPVDGHHPGLVTRAGAVYELSAHSNQWVQRVEAFKDMSYLGNVKRVNDNVFAVQYVAGSPDVFQRFLKLGDASWKQRSEIKHKDAHLAFQAEYHVHGDHILNWSGYGPIMKTSDDGASWEAILFEDGSQLPQHLEMFSFQDDLIVVSDQGVWRLSDDFKHRQMLYNKAAYGATLRDSILHIGPTDRGYFLEIDVSESTPRAHYTAAVDRAFVSTQARLHHNQRALLLTVPNEGVMIFDADVRPSPLRNTTPSHRGIKHIALLQQTLYASDTQGHLFSSTDNKTWQRISLGHDEHGDVRVIERIRAGDGTLFVQTYGGEVLTMIPSRGRLLVQSSSQFGQCVGWFDSFEDWVLAAPCASGVIHGGGLYAAQGALHWTDWSTVHTQLPARRSIQYLVDGLPQVSDMALGQHQWWSISKTIGVRLSTDQGETWLDRTPPGFQRSAFASPPVRSGKAGSIPAAYRFWIEVVGDTVIAMNSTHMWFSQDNGLTWKTAALELPQNARIFTVFSDGSRVLIGTQKGVFVLYPQTLPQPPQSLFSAWQYGNVNDISAYNGTLYVTTTDGILAL